MKRIVLFGLILTLAFTSLFGATFDVYGKTGSIDSVYAKDVLDQQYATWKAVSSVHWDGYLSSPFVVIDSTNSINLFCATGSYGGSDDTVRIKWLLDPENLSSVTSRKTDILSSSYANAAVFWPWDSRSYIGSRGTVFRSNADLFTLSDGTGYCVDPANPTQKVDALLADGNILYVLATPNLYSSRDGKAYTKIATGILQGYYGSAPLLTKAFNSICIANGVLGIYVYKKGVIKYIPIPESPGPGAIAASVSSGDGGLYITGGSYGNYGSILYYDSSEFSVLATTALYLNVSSFYRNQLFVGYDEGLSSTTDSFLHSVDRGYLKNEARGQDFPNWTSNGRARAVLGYKNYIIFFAGGGLGGYGVIYAKSLSLRESLNPSNARPSYGYGNPTKGEIDFTNEKVMPYDMDTTGDYVMRNLQVTKSIHAGSTPIPTPNFTFSTLSVFANAVFLAKDSTKYNLAVDAYFRDYTDNLKTGVSSPLFGINEYVGGELYNLYIGSTTKINRIHLSVATSANVTLAVAPNIEYWSGTDWAMAVASGDDNFGSSSVVISWPTDLPVAPYIISSTVVNPLYFYKIQFGNTNGEEAETDTTYINYIWLYTGSSTGNEVGYISADTGMYSRYGEYTSGKSNSWTMSTSSSTVAQIDPAGRITHGMSSSYTYVIQPNIFGVAISGSKVASNYLILNGTNGGQINVPLMVPNFIYGKTFTVTSAFCYAARTDSGETTLYKLTNTNQPSNGAQATLAVVTAVSTGAYLTDVLISANLSLAYNKGYQWQIVQYWDGAQGQNTVGEIIVEGKLE